MPTHPPPYYHTQLSLAHTGSFFSSIVSAQPTLTLQPTHIDTCQALSHPPSSPSLPPLRHRPGGSVRVCLPGLVVARIILYVAQVVFLPFGEAAAVGATATRAKSCTS